MIGPSGRAAWVGALVAAIVTLPGLGLGTLWDNSETAYGEVAREILLFGDPIVLHFNGTPWFVQPPLYFWIAAALANVFGVGELAMRLPSALATIAMAGAVGYVVARLTTSRAALLAALVLSTSLMQAVVGRLAIMDALLDLAIALAILAWFAALRTGAARWWYAGWIALGFGTLTKGPVAIVVTVLVIGVWALWEVRNARGVQLPGVGRWLLGIALFAAIVGPWAVVLARAAGPVAFSELVGHYTVGRYLGTIENQSGPIWYYLPVVIIATFPWFPFLVPATIEAFREAGEHLNGSLARLALAWAIVPFAFFSLAQTKLPNYIALELPALAILIAVWFDRAVERTDRRVALAATAVVPVSIGAIAFAIWAFSHDNRLVHDLQEVIGALASAGFAIFMGSVACFVLLLRNGKAWLGPFAIGAASVVTFLLIVLGEPAVERFKPIPQFAAAIQRDRRPNDVVAIQGVSGGNALVFYTHPPVENLDVPDHLTGTMVGDPKRVICSAPRAFVVTAKKRPAVDPTYGRNRRALMTLDNDVLFVYDGPACAPEAPR